MNTGDDQMILTDGDGDTGIIDRWGPAPGQQKNSQLPELCPHGQEEFELPLHTNPARCGLVVHRYCLQRVHRRYRLGADRCMYLSSTYLHTKIHERTESKRFVDESFVPMALQLLLIPQENISDVCSTSSLVIQLSARSSPQLGVQQHCKPCTQVTSCYKHFSLAFKPLIDADWEEIKYGLT